MIELPLRGAVIRDKQLVIPLGAEVLEGLKQRVLTPRALILDDGRTITDKQRKIKKHPAGKSRTGRKQKRPYLIHTTKRGICQ